jgi:hypothetical protein
MYPRIYQVVTSFQVAVIYDSLLLLLLLLLIIIIITQLLQIGPAYSLLEWMEEMNL